MLNRLIFYGLFFSFIKMNDGKLFARILGGERTKIERYPYGVNLSLRNRGYCTGSLISSQCVLTAAHCMQNQQVETVIACTGNDRYGKGICSNISQIIISPVYNAETLDVDFALLRLDNSLLYKNIKPVQLDFTEVKPETSVIGIGWGDTGEENSKSYQRVLRGAKLTTISLGDCENQMSPLTENMMCAKDYNGKFAMYDGDSGGPLLYKGKQVGILSGSSDYDTYHMPAVYVKLSSSTVRKYLEGTIRNYCRS